MKKKPIRSNKIRIANEISDFFEFAKINGALNENSKSLPVLFKYIFKILLLLTFLFSNSKSKDCPRANPLWPIHNER